MPINEEVTCPHTLCEHLGGGKLRCRHCGATIPMMVTTIRVNAEDYEALQKLYTGVRALMQAKSGQYYQDKILALGALVGMQPKLMPIIENDDERVNALIHTVLAWYDSHSEFSSLRDQALAVAVREYKKGIPDALASVEIAG